MSLSEKVGLVTGSGSGIGRSIARILAARGARIIVADINAKGGEDTVRMIHETGGTASFVQMDVSDGNQVRTGILSAVRRFGGLNILVNDAGIDIDNEPIMELREDTWDRTMNVNLKGVFLCTKYAIPEMIRSGKKKEAGGSIINIASIAGIHAVPSNSAYCASKGGVIAFTRATAMDCAHLGIRANCICPGTIMTPLQARFSEETKGSRRIKALYEKGIPIGRIGRPEDIGYLVSFLASEEASFITGSIFIVDGGRTAELGDVLIDKISQDWFSESSAIHS